MKIAMPSLVLVLLLATGCNQTGKKMKASENPFFSEFSTPFQVPPFDLIEEDHFLPAYERALAEQKEEIEEITGNTDDPSFENTLEAFDLALHPRPGTLKIVIETDNGAR